MFFLDKGTRDLLPLIELHLDKITGAPPEFDRDHARRPMSRSRQTPLNTIGRKRAAGRTGNG